MNEFVITATRSMKDYASRVVSYVTALPRFSHMAEGINGVELLKTERFADGEMEVSITESVRGKDVVIFASSARNDAGLGVEEAKTELYHAVDALKRSQARKIMVFEPFISCSRSDRATGRNSVGLWIHFKILAGLGAAHIITYQLHSNKSVSMLDPTVCTIDNIPALNLLKRYLCDAYIRDMKTLEKDVRGSWAFCSVDAGGEKFTKEFANAFGAPLVVAHKQRDYSKINTIESINILSAEPIDGKILWIVDDMIDTAGSIESLIKALTPLRPREINIIASHAIFSPPAAERLSRLTGEGLLNRLIVTDTVSTAALSEKIPRLEIVPSAELSAGIIRILVSNESLSKTLLPFSAEKYLKSPNLFNTQ
ncbi:MAG: ribose-phosphate diphosphokinase [Treponema sp.]|nr:ribose-phosphate diphosphokinase [Treponema sp.]